jgi:two-component system phosphate regulon sensor histidine kinase PhoR
MKKKSIGLMIVLASFSLLGLIITQLFWVNNAIKLAENQYDSRVTIALQGALDEYILSKEGEICDQSIGCLAASGAADSLFINLVPAEMDSLLKVHFEYHGLDTVFNFSIVKCQTGEVIYAKKTLEDIGDNISVHRISLSCLHHEESHHLQVAFGAKHKFILKDIMMWLIASVLFLLVVILVFSYTLFSMVRQKKISDIRNDFINNMTHEFKTPLANISLASEVLKREETSEKPQRVRQYAGIIFDENQRMRTQVERVLQVAVRDREDLRINLQSSDLHLLIRQAVDHMCLPDCDPEVEINLELNAANPVLRVDPMHFSNIIHNLLDNAKKYSGSKPVITIRTLSKKDLFIVEVEDNGIGISAEAQKHIFDKFYRVPTGNVHNVKGFGLGLNYVKRMVQAHGGNISLRSEPGKGSTFRITFPLKN